MMDGCIMVPFFLSFYMYVVERLTLACSCKFLPSFIALANTAKRVTISITFFTSRGLYEAGVHGDVIFNETHGLIRGWRAQGISHS
jgi:hypothetical protein